MTLRPLPDDPDSAVIESMLDLASEEWLLAAPGDYQAGAVYALTNEGEDRGTLVALEWPARPNGGGEDRTLRLLIDPADAVGLAAVLAHVGEWILACRRRMS